MAISDGAHEGALDGMLGKINGGAGNPNGYLKFKQANATLIATAQLSNPAFNPATTLAGPPISHQATAATIQPSDQPQVSVTIGIVEFCNRANVAVFDRTVSVGGGGGQIIMDNPAVPANAANIIVDSLIIKMDLT